MSIINDLVSKKQSIDYKKRNQILREAYMNGRKDKEKNQKLREKRLQRINEYREEQVAALKH